MEELAIEQLRATWEEAEQKVPARQGVISPSRLTQGCKLAIYHDMLSSPFKNPERSAEDLMTLWTGEFLHQKVQEGFEEHYRQQGIVYVPEVAVHIYRSCRGTADAQVIDGDSSITDEYKTIGKASFESLTRAPLESHEDQLQLYIYGNGSESGRIIYICRDNFYMKEFQVDPKPQKVEKYLKIIDEIEDAVESQTPPEPHKHYLGKTPCTKICFYRDMCPLAKKEQRRKI